MKIYESAKIELLTFADKDVITTSYPSPEAGTESPILPAGVNGYEW